MDEWKQSVPTQIGLYWVRDEGASDGGRVVEIVGDGRARFMGSDDFFDANESLTNSEFKVAEGYGSSV